MDDFVVRALLAGLGIALIAGPLGSFVVWRRMAFFGDTLAHTALLGIALGLVLNIDLNASVVIVCVIGAVALVLLQASSRLANDTVLGILAYGSLAVGLVVVSMVGSVRIDLVGYLFGDVLAATRADIAWIYGAVAVTGLLIAVQWRALLSIAVDPDLAQAEGVSLGRTNLAFVVMFALLVAVAIKVVGVLLVAGLLVIPAAAARVFVRTPEQMAILAAVFGAVSVAGGLGGSLAWDMPTGPAIVVAALILFGLSTLYPAVRRSG